jgi:hypothetical protein
MATRNHTIISQIAPTPPALVPHRVRYRDGDLDPNLDMQIKAHCAIKFVNSIWQMIPS